MSKNILKITSILMIIITTGIVVYGEISFNDKISDKINQTVFQEVYNKN